MWPAPGVVRQRLCCNCYTLSPSLFPSLFGLLSCCRQPAPASSRSTGDLANTVMPPCCKAIAVLVMGRSRKQDATERDGASLSAFGGHQDGRRRFARARQAHCRSWDSGGWLRQLLQGRKRGVPVLRADMVRVSGPLPVHLRENFPA